MSNFHQFVIGFAVEIGRHVLQPGGFGGAVGTETRDDTGNLDWIWAFGDFEEGRSGLRQQPGDGCGNVGIRCAMMVGNAEGIGNLGEGREGNAARGIASGADAVEIAFPSAPKGIVAAIGKDDGADRQVVMADGGQFLQIHHEAAVADNECDWLLRCNCNAFGQCDVVPH